MRGWALSFLVTATALAGCLGGGGDGGNDAVTSPRPLFTQRFPEAGWSSAWEDPRTFFTSPNDSPSKAEVDLRINPTDPSNVVVASKDRDTSASDCVWSIAQVTKDGGQTWTTVYVGGDRANREPALATFDCVTDPMFVFDQEGTLYYAMQAYGTDLEGGTDPQTVGPYALTDVSSTFILARSRDGGLTFDHFVAQHAGDGLTVYHDYPRMLVSPTTGSIHTIWNGIDSLNTPAGGVLVNVQPWISTSRDGGETVEQPRTFVAQDAPQDTQFFSGFAVTSGGVIYITVAKNSQADAGEPTDVWLWKSEDDARTFEEVDKAFTIAPTPRQLPEERNAFRTPSFVELAIDHSGGALDGRLYLFWPEYANDQSDVLCSWSDDAVTWSAPVNVALNSKNDQFFMRPVVGPDGVPHVMFSSRAWDPQNKLLDQVHAWSEDGGITWNNTRLTSSPFDGDLGIHQYDFPFIGDYNGIDAVPGHIWMAWGDTRTGRAEVAAAHMVRTVK